MLQYVLATFCIVSVMGYSVQDNNHKVLNSETEALRWPDTYTVKAMSYSLTSNIVEDCTAWKSKKSSRLDYNQGAVKVIMTSADSISYGHKFQIHPETTEEELNKIVCHVAPRRWHMALQEIFPALSGGEIFEVVGNETIDDIETVKFEFTDKNRYMDTRKTIWAYYFDGHGWVPVRYELKKYKVKLGSLINHEIMTFSEFSVEFEDEVFDASQFNCDTAPVKHTLDSEKITKELLFVDPEDEKHIDHVYNHFQNKYERKFAHENEQAMRKEVFRNNIKLISSVNRRNLGYKLGINEFSDWTDEELERSHGVISRPEGLTATVAFPYDESKLNDIVSELPKEYDMRLYGLISPVKNQGKCGSCWTFAAAAVTESALARINGGKVLGLSNQAIVDCAYEGLSKWGIGGCNGGFDFAAYNFIEKHGLPTEEEYGPYKNKDGYCRIYNMTKTYPITGFVDVTHDSINAMKVAVVNHGPLFIYIHASTEFKQYSSGIFYQSNKQCSTTRPNHAVTLVGYGERDGILFWILKNSWGTGWGIDGYMLVAAQDNVCGVASKPTYPVF